MESKQPMPWKKYRQELQIEELDEESEVINNDIKEFEVKIMEALVREGLEPPSSLQNLLQLHSEDE